MHYMSSIGCDFPGLVNPFAADWVGCTVRLSFLVRAAAVLCLEVFDAVRVPFQLAGDFCFVKLPGCPLTESGVVFLGV